MNVPTVRLSNREPSTQRNHASPVSRPLGTADWLRPCKYTIPHYKQGDLWLSRLPTGEAIGSKDDRHAIAVAGTRGGKDVSFVIPNLIHWLGSMLVIDPTGENAIVTARRRALGSIYCNGLGQKVYILDPYNAVKSATDDFSDLKACFNPLDILRIDDARAPDLAGQIADSFVSEAPSGDESYWNLEAPYLIKMVILFVVTSSLFTTRERNLITVRRLLLAGLSDLKRIVALHEAGKRTKTKEPSSFNLLFEAMKRTKAYRGLIADAGEKFARMDEASGKTLAGIFGTACAFTNFIDSIPMQDCLSRSDFSFSELKENPDGVTIYLSLPTNDMPSQYRWLRMMVTLAVNEIQKSLTPPASGPSVLMVFNEFAGLQRMQVIENAVAQTAKYGAKMLFVVQNLGQLKEKYKDNWETFVSACGTKLFFSVDDHFTRDYVSKLIGEHDVLRSTRSMSMASGTSSSLADGRSGSQSITTSSGWGSSMSLGSGHSSYSRSGGIGQGHTFGTSRTTTNGDSQTVTETWNETIHKRPLLNPDEVGRLFGSSQNPLMLALISGLQPLVLKRTAYFEDPIFECCFDPHPSHEPPHTLDFLAIKSALDAEEARERAKVAARERVRLAEEKRAQAERARIAEAKRKSIELAEQQRRLQEAGARLAAEARQARAKSKQETWLCITTGAVAFTFVIAGVITIPTAIFVSLGIAGVVLWE